MAVQTRLITTDEFWDIVLNDESYEDRRVELIDGEIIEIPPSRPIDSVIAGRVAYRLQAFNQDHLNLGWVAGANAGYTLDVYQVPVPDASYISKNRYPVLTDRFTASPELVVEVVSKNERPAHVFSKIGLYLRSGVQIVWAIFPDDCEVLVCFQSKDSIFTTKTLDINDTLDGADILPGFTLPVRDIFPSQPAQPENPTD